MDSEGKILQNPWMMESRRHLFLSNKSKSFFCIEITQMSCFRNVWRIFAWDLLPFPIRTLISFGELPFSHWLWCWWMVNPGTSLNKCWSDLILPLKVPGQQRLCSFNQMISESEVKDTAKEQRGFVHFVSGTLTCQETLLGFLLLALPELPWCLSSFKSDCSASCQFSDFLIILCIFAACLHFSCLALS